VKKIPILIMLPLSVFAQDIKVSNPEMLQTTESTNRYILPIDKVSIKGSYPLGISEIKTIHIVFPFEIKEVDAGTSDVIVEITPSFNNVLKVKSAKNKDFTETNLTVLTGDGGLYSFITNYQKDPEILNINIGNNLKTDILASNELKINHFQKSHFVSSSLNISEAAILNNLQKATQSGSFIRNVGVHNLQLRGLLKGIYTEEGILYLTMDILNETDIDYEIDFIKLYIKDKELVKKMTVQEEELVIINKYPSDLVVHAEVKHRFSVATTLRSLSEDKIMEVEIYEKNGGRHLRFPIDPKILSKAKKINQ
jgi:conjugative transposon TraN protein